MLTGRCQDAPSPRPAAARTMTGAALRAAAVGLAAVAPPEPGGALGNPSWAAGGLAHVPLR